MSDAYAMLSSFGIHLSNYTLIFIASHDFGHSFRDSDIRSFSVIWWITTKLEVTC